MIARDLLTIVMPQIPVEYHYSTEQLIGKLDLHCNASALCCSPVNSVLIRGRSSYRDNVVLI
jgi:hypothetical protein